LEWLAVGVRAAPQIRGKFFRWPERAMDCNLAYSLIRKQSRRATIPPGREIRKSYSEGVSAAVFLRRAGALWFTIGAAGG
jgi:hypothetical protein